MAAGAGWTVALAPYQFEPESECDEEAPEPGPEPEEGEEAPEHRHERKVFRCEDEYTSPPDSDSPASAEEHMSDAARQSPKSPGQTTANKAFDTIIGDDEGELGMSLSVGDGRYLVDLGSSSEFIVDEECLLREFRSCRKCSQECKVRKRVEGLKLVLTQVCFFCAHRFTWTNLHGDDKDDDDNKDDSDF